MVDTTSHRALRHQIEELRSLAVKWRTFAEDAINPVFIGLMTRAAGELEDRASDLERSQPG